MTSSLGNRLAGLPKIPKIRKKSSKSTKSTKATKATKSTKSTKKPTPKSPPKPAPKPIAPAPPAVASNSTPGPSSSAPKFPIELSDDDTLSELESSSESSEASSGGSSDESDSDDSDDEDDEAEPQPAAMELPSLASVVLPPLPPLPPLPSLGPAASTSSKPPPPLSTIKSSLVARPKSFQPFNATTTPLPSPPAPAASTSAPSPAPSKPKSPAPPPPPPPAAPSTSAAPSPTSQPQPAASSSSSRPKSSSNPTSTTSHHGATTTTMLSPSDHSYSPSNPISRTAVATSSSSTSTSTNGANAGGIPAQRMSLRQVLALSLQEAEDKNSSRENTPDANDISNLARGKKASASSSSKKANKLRKKQQQQKNKDGDTEKVKKTKRGKNGNASDDSFSSAVTSGASSSSDASDSEDQDDDDDDEGMRVADVAGDAENEVGNMEKAEERLLRAEIEKKKKVGPAATASSVSKGKPRAVASAPPLASVAVVDDVEMDEDTDDDDDDDEEDDGDESLMDAWDKNVRAMEQIRRKRTSIGGPQGGGETSFDRHSDGGDSDVAVTDLPPGNGFGVVTWSDYDSFGTDDDDDDDDDDDRDDLATRMPPQESQEDALAQILLADKEGIAGEFEAELEQLFALSEAVVGPVRQDEYEAGDMWFEALSDGDGSTADDEIDEGLEDDIDAEMIFGEDGELKRLFGSRKKRRYSAVDSSAGETDFEDDQATESGDEEDVELVRVGVHLDAEEKRRRQREGAGGDGEEEDDDDETESVRSEDEETDSSCSDTDIYRYAPRTGALANLQAPTTADLASLVIEEPAAPTSSSSSSRPKPPYAPSRHAALSTLEVPTFDHAKGKAKAKVPTFRRRLPKMGTFDTTERKQQANESDSAPKIVVVGSGDELAPSPFRVPLKKTKRRSTASPRRARSDSRISTTSGTSGSTSLDPGSNVGSPVLGNVVFPDFDLDSLLQDSVFDATDNEDGEGVDPGGATSSETDTGALTSQPPPDFSRWSRIPIGAFRSRTMGASGRTAPSQVLTAQAAATELRKNRHKRRNNSTATTAGGESSSSRKKSLSRRGSEDEVASSILRDHKAVKSSLRHTLGAPSPAGGHGHAKKRKTIRSRMLTSPVLAPTTIPTSTTTLSSSTTSTSLAAVAAAVFNKSKKKKNRSKSPAGAPSTSRNTSRQNASAPPATSSTPSANLLPLPPALFPKLEI